MIVGYMNFNVFLVCAFQSISGAMDILIVMTDRMSFIAPEVAIKLVV